MTEPLVVVEGSHGLMARFGAANPVSASSPEELRAAFTRFTHGAVWVARATPMVRWMADLDPIVKTHHRLLLFGNAKASERAFLRAIFSNVIVSSDEMKLLPLASLSEVLASPQRANLLIGGSVAFAAKSVVLVRGNLETLLVPFSWFTPRPKGPKPDFGDFQVIDSGQTIRLGEYEAAVDAALYEFDSDFRRVERKRRIAEDKSFGAALRRLRLQRGLSRADFGSVTAKTIARIERGEVEKPHRSTVSAIAEKLGVRAEEIESF
jgi:hypothetical protein